MHGEINEQNFTKLPNSISFDTFYVLSLWMAWTDADAAAGDKLVINCDNDDDVDGEDDDHSRYHLRSVLAAATHHYSSRRLASKHLDVSVNNGNVRHYTELPKYLVLTTIYLHRRQYNFTCTRRHLFQTLLSGFVEINLYFIEMSKCLWHSIQKLEFLGCQSELSKCLNDMINVFLGNFAINLFCILSFFFYWVF